MTYFQKQPQICQIEEIALKLLYNIYDSDPRYRVDPNQRITESMVCQDHAKLEENGITKKLLQQELCQKFYRELLDESHNKVKPERLNRFFIKTVMDPKEW